MKTNLKNYCQRITALFIIIIIMTSSIPALAQENTNNHFSSQYITVNGKNMRVAFYGDISQSGSEVSFTDTTKTTIVMLPALGVPSPHLYFKPLAQALDTDFNIIILEPLGYGLSDLASTERTIENINKELNTALTQLNISQCVLLVHSISGVYGLEFTLNYPEKIKGFIAIDNTVYDDSLLEAFAMEKEYTLAALKELNAIRDAFPSAEDFQAAVSQDPESYGAVLPEITGYTYSESDAEEYMRAFAYGFNKNIEDEVNRMDQTVLGINGKKFPDALPVLMMIASANVENVPAWETGHRNQINLESGNHEFYILEGQHYIWYTNLNGVVEKIKDWKNKFDM